MFKQTVTLRVLLMPMYIGQDISNIPLQALDTGYREMYKITQHYSSYSQTSYRFNHDDNGCLKIKYCIS